MNFNWRFNHLGMMVADRDEILHYYQSIGLGLSVGPQPLLPYEEGEGEITFFRELDGDPVSHKYITGGPHNFRDGQSQIGNCQIEVYPMKPGPGMFISRYVESKGGGINHIAFNTADIENDTNYFKDLGCDLVFNVSVNGKTTENYIDTRKHGDLMISLRPSADEWENSWRRNNESHPLVSNWNFIGQGICVNDLNAASDYYSSLGFEKISEEKDDKEWSVSRQQFSLGEVSFELIQENEKSIYRNSLSQRGEGVSEIIFEVEDLESELLKFEKKGISALIVSGNKKKASIDTREKGNILITLFEKL